jgi:hypothetical protein
MNSFSSRAAFGLLLLGAGVFLAQIWFEILRPDVFLKTLVTLGVALALLLIWGFIQRENRASAKLRDPERRD